MISNELKGLQCLLLLVRVVAGYFRWIRTARSTDLK